MWLMQVWLQFVYIYIYIYTCVYLFSTLYSLFIILLIEIKDNYTNPILPMLSINYMDFI